MGSLPLARATLVAKEATMEEHFVWMTTRQVKPGTLTDFERAWRPHTHPEGMLRAYASRAAAAPKIIVRLTNPPSVKERSNLPT
jgi:hypothetical protein